MARPPDFPLSRPPMCSLSLQPGNSLTVLMTALSSDSRSSVSFPPADHTTGLWFLPWRDCLLLNTPAFAGHTIVWGYDPDTIPTGRRDCAEQKRSQPSRKMIDFLNPQADCQNCFSLCGGTTPWRFQEKRFLFFLKSTRAEITFFIICKFNSSSYR